MNLSIVILAAGAGTRMKSKTPKVLHKIAGREMLYYVIREAKKLSDDVSVVLFHEYEQVRSRMERYFPDLCYVIQDYARYPGTGGALMGIAPKYEKILVLNGDMPLVESAQLARFLECDAPLAMSVFEPCDPLGYGRVVIHDGMVERIIEEKDANSEEKLIKSVNAGVYLFRRELLQRYLPKLRNDNAQCEYYLTDVIALARRDGVQIPPLWVQEESFQGVNSKADLAQAETVMLERIRGHWMRRGVSMRLPESIYIEDGVQFIGECTVENGASITGDSYIEESHIKAHSVIEDSRVIRSDIGPMAHLRPECEIIDSHIGNFVEVKKSTLHDVKAGHLSYLGDCEVGAGSNIGAGVITCNYDGKKKSFTKIGKNVFVGSDSQLIAPLNIQDDSIIGAGSTITKEVKTGELALSRTKQENIQGFFTRYFSKK
ncbi:MAG: bifunctional UDP-N-acetylglucosamine diphosphorylase/glucosamine-1-phosphate N-acetyltransferase GlmU [Wolinella sp.]